MEKSSDIESVTIEENIPCIGEPCFPKATNCTFVGWYAGSDYTDENIDGVVLIGDNVRSLTNYPDDSILFGKKVVIGPYLFGEKLNLKDIYLFFSQMPFEERERRYKAANEQYESTKE